MLGLATVWYDMTTDDDTITSWTHRLVYQWPVLAYLAGLVTAGLLVGLARAWGTKFRYALALLALGFCLGHLFWAWPAPRRLP